MDKSLSLEIFTFCQRCRETGETRVATHPCRRLPQKYKRISAAGRQASEPSSSEVIHSAIRKLSVERDPAAVLQLRGSQMSQVGEKEKVCRPSRVLISICSGPAEAGAKH